MLEVLSIIAAIGIATGVATSDVDTNKTYTEGEKDAASQQLSDMSYRNDEEHAKLVAIATSN